MSKYTVAGVAKNNKGQMRVRFSTLPLQETIQRQVFAQNTDIMYVELPKAMSREEIPTYLLGLTDFNTNAAYKAALVKASPVLTNKSKGIKMPSKPKAVEIDKTLAALAA